MKEKELRAVIDKNVMTSIEVQKYCGFTRSYLNKLVNQGRIEPLECGMYFRPEIEAFQREREKEKV